jgi:hypothetical protein
MIEQTNQNVFRGTVNDFVNAGLKINGMTIDKVTLSGMGRYKLLKQVGEQKPTRGRSAAVYEIDTSTDTKFSF